MEHINQILCANEIISFHAFSSHLSTFQLVAQKLSFLELCVLREMTLLLIWLATLAIYLSPHAKILFQITTSNFEVKQSKVGLGI